MATEIATPLAIAQSAQRRTTPLWRRALRNPRIIIGGAVLLLLFLMAALAPVLAPGDPLRQHPQQRLAPPSAVYPLGTDEFGRDLLSRLIYGSRVSLQVAFGSIALAVLIGVPLGLVGGYFGRGWETVTMRLMDVLLAFPPILLAIAVVAFLGPGVWNLIFVIGILYTPRFARLVHASTLSERTREYVEAARAMGARSPRILMRGVLPNITAPIIVQVSLSLGFAILVESGLSFLGIGVRPPNPSWGLMIATGRGYMSQSVWPILWPSVAISLVILACNILGDGLRDTLDPRLRR
jgi:ABC-type dipeptide/oligopeptide/nickel transport system permease subunit